MYDFVIVLFWRDAGVGTGVFQVLHFSRHFILRGLFYLDRG